MATANWLKNDNMKLELNGTTFIFTETEWLRAMSKGRKYDKDQWKN
jgi:hypothetical protein